MATAKFFIIDNPDKTSDGIIKDKEKNLIGRAWNEPAPDGTFINCSLEGYWIITDEEYKHYKQLKKHEKISKN